MKAGRDICTEFTVSDCHPGPEHQIGDPIFENLPDFGDNVYLKPCEEACQNREDCLYWRVKCSGGLCNCTLHKTGYLHACLAISGGADTPIEDCKDQNASAWSPPGDPCNDLVDEDCDYLGRQVHDMDNVRSDEECKNYLNILGSIYNAKHFTYHSVTHACVLYESSDRDCRSMTGTKESLVVDRNCL